MTQFPEADPADGHPPPPRSWYEDMMALGPASTPEREAVAAITQIGVVFLTVFVIAPDRISDPVRIGLSVGVVAYVAWRFIAGRRLWSASVRS